MTTERIEKIHLPYTICFCVSPDKTKVLMLYRYNRPNQFKWNGLGGKLEPDELPDEGVRRELLEEAEIPDATVAFKGIVTWHESFNGETKIAGMYAYTSPIDPQVLLLQQPDTREGLLEWKEVTWVCDFLNSDVIENIPYFLPHLLGDTPPAEYRCTYSDKKLVNFEILPLPHQ